MPATPIAPVCPATNPPPPSPTPCACPPATLTLIPLTHAHNPAGTLYISYRGLLFLAASLAGSYPLIAKLLPAAA